MVVDRELITGSVEYLSVTVTSNIVLDTQPVTISPDRGVTFYAATWLGAPSTQRQAQILLGTTEAPMPSCGVYTVYVRVVDSPEIPVIDAGTLRVRNP